MAGEGWRRGLIAAALLATGALAQSPQPGPSPRLQACMACHGQQGISTIPTIPSLAGQPRLFIENQLVLIREGLRDVPQMKGLLDGVSDAEIVQMAAYFSDKPAPPTASGAPDTAKYQRGQEIAARSYCGSCHLPDYSGRQQVPRLAGQHEAFLLEAMKQFRDHSGLGRDTIMAATLRGMKDEELADLAHYLAYLR